MHYGFVVKDSKNLYRLTILGERVLKYTDNARVDFMVSNVKLQEREPFLFLKKELERCRTLSINQLGDLLRIKFYPREKWSNDKIKSISNAYAKWLVYLRQGKIENNLITYVGGAVRTFDILASPKVRDSLDRNLYDILVENFHTPHNILDEPYELLEIVKTSNDANKKGQAFETFVAACFRRLGFTSRCRDGPREKTTNLSYQRKGGGDVAIFSHFPIFTSSQTYQGYAIGCETKASQYPIGSRAVGQARNLCQKIKETFPDYLVHTAIVSRSICGYDSSGREQAPPEVVHLNYKILLELLETQKSLLEKGERLITPLDFALVINELIREQKLEPTPSEFKDKILEIHA